ncbi:GNAT family N-acetyltransferase [Thalassovita taeanensis]|uniref:Phosphinothricin acetyltransferase n=1 Tax=Thalassovita taeanensis TaxID=657014 RepID=A0A1H9EJ56_9RHOB|nr:GNAT family N-acetyltransferase [Thalassovita taeanensis]SEQ25048.1 phosphinothricin acetyltransferase [Thalassovita taeanensis]
MSIRAATPADAPRIAEIWNHVIRTSAATFSNLEKTPEGLAQDFADKAADGKTFLVAEIDGQVVGFATYFQFRGGPGYAKTMEHTVILAPRAHGRGLGRALMAGIEEHARAGGAHSIFAGVSAENEAGVAFHAAVGYAEVARLSEVGFKFGRWMDLVLMQKML